MSNIMSNSTVESKFTAAHLATAAAEGITPEALAIRIQRTFMKKTEICLGNAIKNGRGIFAHVRS